MLGSAPEEETEESEAVYTCRVVGHLTGRASDVGVWKEWTKFTPTEFGIKHGFESMEVGMIVSSAPLYDNSGGMLMGFFTGRQTINSAAGAAKSICVQKFAAIATKDRETGARSKISLIKLHAGSTSNVIPRCPPLHPPFSLYPPCMHLRPMMKLHGRRPRGS